MAGMKTAVTRFGGRALARLISKVARSSRAIYEPADLRVQLRATHPCIVAGWHGQFMLLCQLHPGDIKVSAMVARHGDAEFIAEAMRHFNTDLIRGAGAGGRKRDRGGAAALRGAVKALTGGSSLVMTADIPPGPARVAGTGIIMIAKFSGCPIVPVAAASSRFASFDTWSRMTVNLPYSDVAYVGGEPIHVPRDASEEMIEDLRRKLESDLNAVTARAYELAGADIERATPLAQLAAKNPPPPSLGLKVYAGALSAFRPAVPLLLSTRERQGKEDGARRGERLGRASRSRPSGSLVWFHAASVGETNVVLPLIDDILKSDQSANVLLTTGTTTSAALAARRLPDRAMHQFVPLDVPQYTARFLDHWQPNLAVFTESDIWPNLVLATAARAIPLALINARMSPRSMKRWRRNGRMGRPLFSRFNVVLAQNDGVARTIKQLGAPNVIISGNLKIDSPAPPIDAEALTALRLATEGRPVLLAASTHAGEEAIFAQAFSEIAKNLPGLLAIIVPRHPERGSAIAADMASRGLSCERRSATPLPSKDTQVYIADTIGELGTFYALAPVAFIGGSLVEHGGQNPIEPVRIGTAILTGPHHHNFTEIYDELIASGGVREVKSADELAIAATKLLTDSAAAADARARAELALNKLGGAMAKTLSALKPLLTTRGR